MSPRLDQTNLFARVPAPPGVVGVPGPRYQLGEVLGAGATSTVYAAYDTNFARTVAVKVIDGMVVGDAERLREFITEARISATLEHPNILPVYDMDRTTEGGVYLSMREIAGMSLAEAIEQAVAGDPPAAIAALNDRIQVIVHIANAVACAHHRRILHRDIKPANIMLGRFGEVFLVDWGTALQLPESGPAPATHVRIGTPLYMSPEQVRGAEVDERSDIYCLGATLFHLVLLRPPTSVDTTERFWKRKDAGDFDHPTAAELKTIPRQVVAIAEKAFHPDPAQRYASVEEFTADLRAFQVGQLVSAYREPWFERAARWHRAHARILWPAVAACMIVTCATGWLYGEHLKDLARWGKPVLMEQLDESWPDRWRQDVAESSENSGGFQLDHGALVSTGPGANYIYLRQCLAGRVALEFTGMMRPGSPPGDVSVTWTSEEPFGKANPRRRWLLQVGAEDNLYATLVGVQDDVRLDVAPVRMEPGRPYRLRAEIDGNRLSLSIDGRVVLQHDAELPFISGWIGLYAYYPGKEFRDIKLYANGLPERVSVLTLGDNDAQDGLNVRAAEQYRRVAVAHVDSPLGQEALYRQGLALRLAGDSSAAQSTWANLRDQHTHLAKLWEADDCLSAGDPSGALSILKLARREDRRAQQHAALTWVTGLRQATAQNDRATIEEYVSWQQHALANERLVREPTSYALTFLGRPEEALASFPDQPRARAKALLSMGRAEEVVKTCPSVQDQARALLILGRYSEILQRLPQVQWAQMPAKRRLGMSAAIVEEEERTHGVVSFFDLVNIGRSEEALATIPAAEVDTRLKALMQLGRFKEALALGGSQAGWAQVAMGHPETALQIPELPLALRYAAHGCLLVQAARRGDREAQRLHRAQLPVTGVEESGASWFARTILVPVLDTFNGDPQALVMARDGLRPGQDQRRPEFALRYLTGVADEASLATQPCVQDVPGITALLRAIRLDLAGNRPGAMAAYAAWQALPVWQRSIDDARFEPVSEAFVDWRISVR